MIEYPNITSDNYNIKDNNVNIDKKGSSLTFLPFSRFAGKKRKRGKIVLTRPAQRHKFMTINAICIKPSIPLHDLIHIYTSPPTHIPEPA